MNEHTGFELPLSDYEKGYLTSYYDNVVSPDFKDGVEQSWYGMMIGDRMFDLNAWLDEETSEMVKRARSYVEMSCGVSVVASEYSNLISLLLG